MFVVDFFSRAVYTWGMERYEHTEEFKVKFCEADFKDELKLSVLLAYLQEAACYSAEELGFGYEYVKARGHAFMVTNVCCSLLRPIALGEKVVVKTWPTPPSHVVFGREYRLLSASGEILVNASSRWCLVDMRTGRLAQSKVLDNQDYSTYNAEKVLENVRWKLPSFSEAEGELRFSMTVANSEYDNNMHVNNTRYANYCMNCFSVEELSQRRVRSFSISYLRQCREGEVLRFYRKRAEEGGYLVHGFNEPGEAVVRSYIEFEE